MATPPPEAHMPLDTMQPAVNIETPPPSLGYATPMPSLRPVRTLAGAVSALVFAVVLLCIALYALLYIVRALMLPQGLAPRGNDWEMIMSFVIAFAAVCT